MNRLMNKILPRRSNEAGERPATRHVVDYEMEDFVRADSREQYKALSHSSREEILALLSERAATITHLAAAMGKPKGSVGYHAKVLEQAGLVRVVRTNKVRAMTEKYYGRTARTVILGKAHEDDPFLMLDAVRGEATLTADASLPMFTMRRARITQEQAVAFAERVLELSEEFLAQPREGDRVYGLIAGVYPTALPALGEDASDGE
jgi:DNA-binding transcriptional ArsR family regulator